MRLVKLKVPGILKLFHFEFLISTKFILKIFYYLKFKDNIYKLSNFCKVLLIALHI